MFFLRIVSPGHNEDGKCAFWHFGKWPISLCHFHATVWWPGPTCQSHQWARQDSNILSTWDTWAMSTWKSSMGHHEVVTNVYKSLHWPPQEMSEAQRNASLSCLDSFWYSSDNPQMQTKHWMSFPGIAPTWGHQRFLRNQRQHVDMW